MEKQNDRGKQERTAKEKKWRNNNEWQNETNNKSEAQMNWEGCKVEADGGISSPAISQSADRGLYHFDNDSALTD